MLIRSLFISCLVLIFSSVYADTSIQLGGHSKYRLHYSSHPTDSVYRRYLGDTATDQNADIRFKYSWQNNSLNLQTDYQLIALSGDTLENSLQLPTPIFSLNNIQNDDQRPFDLTSIIHEENDRILLHRLDRLYIGHTSEKLALRFGRQAISWGNGLIYTPFDFFNPFDPAAIDKEYKTGDDMLYGQYLYDSGNDIQLVRVFRRNTDGDIRNDVASTALKFHASYGHSEYDLLIAEHYDGLIFGLGGNTALGGAIWHGDITVTETINDTVTNLVTGLSYSWTWGQKNFSGIVEYYYNGFGTDSSEILIDSLLQNPDLLSRIERGEIFTLARHYVAISSSVELSPLWLLTPGLFCNLDDHSVLFQLISQHDLSQNIQLMLAVDIPFGSDRTEYGGIGFGLDNLKLSFQNKIFAQLSWYF